MKRDCIALFLWGVIGVSFACSPESPRAPVLPPPTASAASTPIQATKETVAVAVGVPADTMQAPVMRSGDTTARVPCRVIDAAEIKPPPIDTTASAFLRGRDSMEVHAIRRAEGRVSRVEGKLNVCLTSGYAAIYPAHGYGDRWHHYIGHLKTMRAHIINLAGGEGSGVYLLIDDSTGDTTERLAASPVMSPDGARFAVVSAAGDAGYDSDVIEIWRAVPRKPEKEFSFEPDYEASQPVWRDSETLDFIKTTFVPNTQTPDKHIPGRVRRIGGKWVIGDP